MLVRTLLTLIWLPSIVILPSKPQNMHAAGLYLLGLLFTGIAVVLQKENIFFMWEVVIAPHLFFLGYLSGRLSLTDEYI
jgi:hypothetical protein